MIKPLYCNSVAVFLFVTIMKRNRRFKKIESDEKINFTIYFLINDS